MGRQNSIRIEEWVNEIYDKVKDTQIGYIILLIYNILELPMLQAVINIVFTIWLSIFATSTYKTLTFWIICIIYIDLTAIFVVINNHRRFRRNIEKHLLSVSKNLKKLQYKRIKELERIYRNNSAGRVTDIELASEGDCVCEAIFEVLSDYLNYDKIEIVLYIQYEDDEGMYLTPISFGAKDNEPPACITTDILIDCENPYRIVQAFADGENIKYLTGEEVKKKFTYPNDEARERETIKQYLALPIRKRDGIATSVLQICIYKEGVIPLKSNMDSFISEYITPFSTFFELCLEEQKVLEVIN